MKAYLKKELCEKAGVSPRTFTRWLKTDEEELRKMGVDPSARLLPPKAVNYLIRKYDLDIEDST